MQHKHGRSALKLSADSSSTTVRSDEGSSADPDEGKRLFAIVRSMLVYTGLIEQLQQFFKKGKKSSGSSNSSEKDEGSSQWEATMKERMSNVPQINFNLNLEHILCLSYMLIM
jgi:E3 ubiquitin-protein ligase UBR4